MEGAHFLLFRWFPFAEVEHLRLYPTYFRQTLLDLPRTTRHVVHHDLDD
jgi:hypothetical protein